MPTEEHRRESARINALALRLCDEWQKAQTGAWGRSFALDELGAFMAGVVAAENAREKS